MADDRQKTLAFIEDYRISQILWNNKHLDYTNKTKRKLALNYLSKKYGMDVVAVKNKIKCLRSYFCREHKVVIKKTQVEKRDKYQSSWFAYRPLMFIVDSITPSENEKKDNAESSSILDQSTETASLDESSDYLAYFPKMEYEFVQPTRQLRNTTKAEDESYRIVSSSENTGPRDECATFGDLIAHKLRKLNPRHRLHAERRINNIFFNLELEEIDTSKDDPLIAAHVPVVKLE